eukprot:1061573-Lingulodinium_polyedra.AAC.1
MSRGCARCFVAGRRDSCPNAGAGKPWQWALKPLPGRRSVWEVWQGEVASLKRAPSISFPGSHAEEQ